MLQSLRHRVYALSALLLGASLMLVLLLLQNSYRARDSYLWVNHTQEVIISLDTMLADLREAESGLRGFLLTKSEDYVTGFADQSSSAGILGRNLRRLVVDNPPQERRATLLEGLVAEKRALMAAGIVEGRAGGGGAIQSSPLARARGKALMDGISALAARMRETERMLLDIRTAKAERQATQIRRLLIFGWPLLAMLIAAVAWFVVAQVIRPLCDLLVALGRFGSGDRSARATHPGSSTELVHLFSAFNAMADRLIGAMDRQNETEAELAHSNAELVQRSDALERRGQSIAVVGGMAHRLHAVQGDGELEQVLDCFLPQVFPGMSGALYVHSNSRNMLVRLAGWGEPHATAASFAPDACWALRRGRVHSVPAPGADIACKHADDGFPVERLCTPILAGGDVLGLLYVEGPMDEESRFRKALLVENVALALVSDHLRMRLREQSIRDPLTGLFNRRYMEEALALETARAARSNSPLSIVMADIDHFKRFNDGFGHEAGDALLKAVAELIRTHFRNGDIVCRYGGEEFTVIAPGADLPLICARADELRRAVETTSVEFRGQRIGPVTISFGIDCWAGGDAARLPGIVGSADRALYAAKRLGRNRIEVAQAEPVAAAAE